MSAEYPFGRAPRSFFLGGAAPDRLPPGPPLLAYGANASPQRLEAKLPGEPVAALAGTLRGWAVVHSDHVSPYGAVPATIVRAARREIAVHVLLVGSRDALDATEGNYDRVLLGDLDLHVDVLGALDAAEAYISKHGPLLVGGEPVALGALAQADLLALVERVRDET